MLYFVTHARREGTPNPPHTEQGLLALVSPIMLDTIFMIRSFGASVVYVGTGKRFRETYAAFSSVLGGLKIIYSPIFGNEDSRRDVDGKSLIVTSDGEEIPEDQYFSLADCKGFDCWKTMKSLSDGAIVVTGREFIKCFDIRSSSCSIYEVDPSKKKITCIVKSGRFVNELSTIRTKPNQEN